MSDLPDAAKQGLNDYSNSLKQKPPILCLDFDGVI